jgi:hypothetical protein
MISKAPRVEPLRLLICGIPATGKSTFGRWLKKEHGFTFIELEAKADQENSLDHHGLRVAWESFWCGDDLGSFPEALLNLPGSLALEWGFPVNLLHVIVVLQQAGLIPWWFEGDRLAARQLFTSRDPRPPEQYDYQMASISAAWCSLAPVFAGRILRVVKPEGIVKKPAQIYSAIVDTV